MATNTEKVSAFAGTPVEKLVGFWTKFSKPIIYASTLIILLVGGYLIYKYMVKIPKENKANEAVYPIQRNFTDFANAQDDTTRKQLAEKVLNGEGTIPGAVKFISKHSGTAAANLCNYYAGACYLHLKQYDKAIKYLKDFSSDATQIESRCYGMIGDAYAELKKNDDALSYYKKAAGVNTKDEFTSSEFLFRAGLFAESIGKPKDAIALYKKIRDDYPTSTRGTDIDRYLARLGELGE